jgi:sugar phosphate isomerase/epimerase
MSNPPSVSAALALEGLPTTDARAGFDAAAAARYRGIAFATSHRELNPDLLGPSARRHVKTILAGKRLQIDSIRAAAPRGGLADAATIDRTLENARKAIGLARALGVATVTLHVGHVPADTQTAAGVPQSTVVSAVRELAQVADAAGVTLALSSAGDPMALAAVMKQVDCERAKVNLEGAQLIAQAHPLQAAEVFAGQVGQLTAADGIRRGQALLAAPLGEGQLPLAELLQLLNEQGFIGPLVVDVRDLPNALAGAHHAAEVLARLLRRDVP